MKKTILLAFIFTAILLSCSKRVVPENQENNKLKFNILPYGISLKDAKNFFEKNKINIINETSFINEGRIRNVISTEGTVHSEYCTINFHFMDGILEYGEYEFRETIIRKSVQEIKENLIGKLSAEFSKAPSIKYNNSTFLEWEFENGLVVSLYDYEHLIIILYDGKTYLKKQNG